MRCGWSLRSTPANGPGLTSEEYAEIKRLKRENAELRRANEILKAASAFFAAELDRPQRARDVHRRAPGAAFGVEPICRVLTEHGCTIAPSTYYDAAKPARPSQRSAARRAS